MKERASIVWWCKISGSPIWDYWRKRCLLSWLDQLTNEQMTRRRLAASWLSLASCLKPHNLAPYWDVTRRMRCHREITNSNSKRAIIRATRIARQEHTARRLSALQQSKFFVDLLLCPQVLAQVLTSHFEPGWQGPLAPPLSASP